MGASKMRLYRDINKVSNYIKALAPEWQNYLNEWCFAKVCNMLLQENTEKNVLHNSYVVELLGQFDPESAELTVPSGTIDLRTKTPSMFGLPSGPFQFKHHQIKTDRKYLTKLLDHVEETYNLNLKQYLAPAKPVSDLWFVLSKDAKKMTVAQFCIQFTLAFTSSFLAPVATSRVNLDILRDIIPFERISKLNWSGFVVDELREIKNGNGCLYLLHIAKEVYGQVNNSPPRGSPYQMVDGTNDGDSGSTAVHDLESLSSSAKSDVHLLLTELEHRYGCLQPFMDKEPQGLDDQSDEDASDHAKDASEEEEYDLEDPTPLDNDQGSDDAAHEDQPPLDNDQGSDDAAHEDQPPLDDDQGNEAAAHEDQPPLEGDQGNEAAAHEVDQGHGADQAAHEQRPPPISRPQRGVGKTKTKKTYDCAPRAMGKRKIKKTFEDNDPTWICEKDPDYPMSPTPKKISKAKPRGRKG